MCSSKQDNIRRDYGPGGAPTLFLPDTAMWQPTESSFDPSKVPDSSIVPSMPPIAPIDDPYPWTADENNEREDATRDGLYLPGPPQYVSNSHRSF